MTIVGSQSMCLTEARKSLSRFFWQPFGLPHSVEAVEANGYQEKLTL